MKIIILVINLIVSICYAKPIKVMVLDSGISVHSKLIPYVQYNGTKAYYDHNGHGTHVAGIIALGSNQEDKDDPLCHQIKIYSCKVFFEETIIDPLGKTVDCINKAISEHFDYINYSGGGSFPYEPERQAFLTFTKQGGIVYVAAGNNGQDLVKNPYYPASYAIGKDAIPLIVVANLKDKTQLHETSNFYKDAVNFKGTNIFSTKPNNSYGFFTGTSQAAPGALHEALKLNCKQLIKRSKYGKNR